MKNKNEQRGLFDEQYRLNKISQCGDTLEKLNGKIQWELFRPLLNEILDKEAQGPGGRPPFDYVMMFKILILQKYYNMSDDQTEFQILDRLSFMRFLGLTLSDKVPDSKTVWLYREQLKEGDSVKKLFDLFAQHLKKNHLIVNQGKILDASIVETPIQRNTREENQQIKEGQVPKQWTEQPDKLEQKDTDARWVKKDGEDSYGYKNNIKVDTKSKLIDNYIVTDAATHDSQPGEKLLTKKDKGQSMHGDSAYSGEPFRKKIVQAGMIDRTHEKGYRDHPLTKKQRKSNRAKSRIRARVEHVFGFMANSMKGLFIRSIGMARANINIGLINITYNMFRASYIT